MSVESERLFGTRNLATIALFAAMWGVLNSIFAPVVFRMTGLPILCDMVGFASLTLAVWLVRRFGVASMVGVIATLINFLFNSSGVHFLGFTVASFVYDILARLMGYERAFGKPSRITAYILLNSVLSAAVAGLIIGSFLMSPVDLVRWGGALGWSGLHAVGGFIGGFVGAASIAALVRRKVAR